MTKALFIPADDNLPEEIRNLDGLDDYQAAVGGMIETVPVWGRKVVYFNEEGKILGLPKNNRATELVFGLGGRLYDGDFIAGDMIVLDFDEETGEDLDFSGLSV